MKPRRVTHYRVQGTTWDGRPFDEVAPFTQVQAWAVSLDAIVHPDGLAEHYARDLLGLWNRETARYGGSVYSLPEETPAQTLPPP